MERLAEEERWLRQQLRMLEETKLWLERSGVGIEKPEAMLEIEREIGRLRIKLEEIEKLRQEVMH